MFLQRERQKARSLVSKKIQLQIGQPGWSNFIHPIDQLMPSHDFQCQCQMCAKYQQKKFNQAEQQQTKTIDNKIKARISAGPALRQEIVEQNYHWIIKHLVIPHHKIVTSGLNLRITQTLFFKDGEAHQIYLSKQIQDPAIKRIGKQKLNNTHIQKIFSDRRRKYKDYIKSKTGKKKAEQKKRLFYGQKQVRKQIKDAVLIRYVDGYDQLISQNQFLALFLRRKQDPIWKQIASIRNYINIINPQQSNTSYIVIKFKRDKIKYEYLYQRANTLMKVYGQYISIQQKQYITPKMQAQFIKQLKLSHNLNVYAQYLVYQIVNYIQYFYDQQINNMVIGIFIDQVGHTYINQVYKLQKKSLIKFEWTNQTYRKKMDESQSKVLQNKKQNQFSKQDGIQKRAGAIVKAMFGAYQKMRDKYGLTAQEQDDCQQVANNKFFKTMHPGFNHDLSQVLKNPNLNVSDFKKQYLGFQQKKKPIIKQFTSNMIKTLHLTSPKLKVSPPHGIQQNTKRTHSTFASTMRNRDTMYLTPLKLTQRSKLYQTLPVN